MERLEARICELAGHLTAATCQFLLLIADFDARKGWADWEMPSCAAWLSWKCQIASGTAREQVRVARALGALPAITAEFAAGRLSYAKVRALTRIATPETEHDLLEMATPMTANQMERFAQAHRRVTEADRGQTRPVRQLTWNRVKDLDYVFRAILPAEGAAVVLQALRAARNDLEHPHDQHDNVSAETRAGAADTLPVSHPAHPMRCHIQDGLAVSLSTLALISCNATISTMIHDTAGAILDVGRRTRKPPPALRRAIRERDGYRCQFPGCQSRRTDAHHIVHWASGGETKPGNLISLCKTHHALVHDKGYFIASTPGGFAFYSPQGTPMPGCPKLRAGPGGISTAHDAVITPATIIPPSSGGRLDLNLAIWTAFANARVKAERREREQASAAA